MTKSTAPASTRSKIASIAGIAINIIVALLTLLSAYGGTVNPATSVIPAAMAMVFPVFLFLTLGLTAINLIWWRRRALIGAATLLICAGPALTYCPLNFFRPSAASLEAKGTEVLKVMSFNTLGFYDYTNTERDTSRLNPTLSFILEHDPDIALLQEAAPLNETYLTSLTDTDRAELYRRYPYTFCTRRGIALLSKYPFKRIEVPVSDENAYDVCRYDVAVGADTIHFFNVHLQSIGLNASDKATYRNMTKGDAPGGGISELRRGLLRKLGAAFRARALQAREIRQALDAVSGNIILAGDFNDIPDCYASRTIQGDDMTDAYRHAGLGPAITYHADRFYFRIDQMYYRGNIDARRIDALSGATSDHYPLLAYFTFTSE